MDNLYFDKDVTLDAIRGMRVGVIGYGNQGRAQAMNLKDSGLDVVVGHNSTRPDVSEGQSGQCFLYFSGEVKLVPKTHTHNFENPSDFQDAPSHFSK